MSHRASLLPAILLSVAALVAWPDSIRLGRGPGSSVSIVTLGGSVTVTAVPGRLVSVTTRMDESTHRLELGSSRLGRVVSVRVARTGASAASDTNHLEVAVPAYGDINVLGATGPVTVIGARGTGTVVVAGQRGDVTIRGTAEGVSASTFSGNIRIEGTFRIASARTATGDITILGSIAEGAVDTLGGHTRLEMTEVSRLRVISVSGSQNLRIRFLAPTAYRELVAQTGTGTIRLWLPPEQPGAVYSLSLWGAPRPPQERLALSARLVSAEQVASLESVVIREEPVAGGTVTVGTSAVSTSSTVTLSTLTGSPLVPASGGRCYTFASRYTASDDAFTLSFGTGKPGSGMVQVNLTTREGSLMLLPWETSWH